jgi:hypothetical protein
LTDSAIAGIIIGVIAGVGVIGLMTVGSVFVYRKQKQTAKG